VTILDSWSAIGEVGKPSVRSCGANRVPDFRWAISLTTQSDLRPIIHPYSNQPMNMCF